MAALRANRSFDDDGALIDVRVELEEQALALDDELVSVAALPRERRAEPLARVAEAVDAIEAAVTELATSSASAARPRLDEVLRRIRERATIVDQIRVELDEIPDGPPATTPEGEPAPGPPQVTDEHGRRQGQVS